MEYDKNNIFAKIINNLAPAEKLYEDEFVIAFKNIYPVAPIHILVIPKGKYIDFSDFTSKATPSEISHYFQAINKIIKEQNIDEYRLITNKGSSVGQTIFHFHTHIVGGIKINGLIDKDL